MPVNSSTSSSKFKKLPWAFIVTALIIACVETIIATHVYLILDRSTIGLRYRRWHMENVPNVDIPVFGTSRSMGLDGNLMEQAIDGKYSVFNYSLPNFNTNMFFYHALAKYLADKKEKPKLIMISVPQEGFSGYAFLDHTNSMRMARFRMFFDADFYKRYINPNVDKERDGRYIYYYSPRWWFPSYQNWAFIHRRWQRGRLTPAHIKAFAKDARFQLNRLVRTHGVTLYHESDHINAETAVSRLVPDGKFNEHLKDNIAVEKFINLAWENNIPVVFFEMPLSEERYQKMKTEGYFPYFNEMMEKYEKKYPNFHYYAIEDFNHWGLEYFADHAHHLNQKGYEKFNKDFAPHFVQILKDRGML